MEVRGHPIPEEMGDREGLTIGAIGPYRPRIKAVQTTYKGMAS